MLKRSERNYTEEQLANLNKIVDKHNEGKSIDDTFYYIISLTGQYDVYFTLYRYQKSAEMSAYTNPYKYIKNLSIDIEKAVKEIVDRTPFFILLIESDNYNPVYVAYVDRFKKRTKEGVVRIPSGKYAGKTMAEVFDVDRGYVAWFKNNWGIKSADYDGKPRKLSTEENILISDATELLKLYNDNKIADNKANCKSEFVGTENVRMSITAKVDFVSKNADYVKIYLSDGDNLFYIYDKNYELVKNDVITLSGTPKHIESLGKKMTYFNRIKITKIERN